MKKTARLTRLFLLLTCLSASGQGLPLPVEGFDLDFGDEFRIQFSDPNQNSGGIRYTLVKSTDLQSWTLVEDRGLESAGGRSLGLAAPLGDPIDRLFYRVESEPTAATLGFRVRELQVEEGSGQQVIVVDFVDGDGASIAFYGPVKYEWSGDIDLVSQLTGEVTAAGASVEIPLLVGDNLGTEELNQVRLKLIVDSGTDYEVDPVSAVTTLTIDENDNYWRGHFQTDSELIDLEIYIRRENGSLLVFLTDGTALLEPDALSVANETTSTTNVFHAVFPPVSIPAKSENLVSDGTVLSLRLDADITNAGETVSSDVLSGRGVMTITNPAKSHLTTEVSGIFHLRKDLPLQPDEDIEFE